MATTYKGIVLPPGKEYLYELAKEFGSEISRLAEDDADGKRISFNATPAEMLALVEQAESALTASHGDKAAARGALRHRELVTELRKDALLTLVANRRFGG